MEEEKKVMDSKAEINTEYGMELTKEFTGQIYNPLTETQTLPTYNAELFEFLDANPDAFMRKSSFDGLGEWVKSKDLECQTAYLYACELLDYEGRDLKNPTKKKHYHYSVWLGVRERDGLAFIYAAGQKLTGLAEKLLEPENKSVLQAINNKGAHVKFPKMKELANGNYYMDPELIP